MIVTCAFCGKQVIDGHDCAERRAAMRDPLLSVSLEPTGDSQIVSFSPMIQDGKMIAVSIDPVSQCANCYTIQSIPCIVHPMAPDGSVEDKDQK